MLLFLVHWPLALALDRAGVALCSASVTLYFAAGSGGTGGEGEGAGRGDGGGLGFGGGVGSAPSVRQRTGATKELALAASD